MKIKEAEARTGVSAKNIRFYEEQGLVHPARDEENRYREYTEQDVRQILLIKALRKLGMPLPLIAQVLCGETTIAQAAQEHCAALESTQARLEAALAVCRELTHEAGAPDAEKYLADIARREQSGGVFCDLARDYLTVCREMAMQDFRFIPQGIVSTPREFTDALLAYAAQEKRDITILKEGLSPLFLLDGVEYEATRFNAGREQYILAHMTHPTLVESPLVAPQRRKHMRRLYAALTMFGLLAVLAVLFVLLYLPR